MTVIARMSISKPYNFPSGLVLDRKGNEEILEELKVEPAGEKLRRYTSNMVTTCNKNAQQGAKNNAELETKRTKTTWKA